MRRFFSSGWPLAQRRFHYEQAFECYLRENTIPYVAVDEAKRALAPVSHDEPPSATSQASTGSQGNIGVGVRSMRGRRLPGETRLKSFDFVVYSQTGPNLLVDVKGRKHSGRTGKAFDNWVTQGDVDGLLQWERLFGEGFTGVFAFLYWCESPPPDALFMEVFTHQQRWYALLAVKLSEYRLRMKQRSPRWGTVNLPAAEFAKLAVPMRELL